MKENRKNAREKKDRVRGRMFQRELEIVTRAEGMLIGASLSAVEWGEEYRLLVQRYKKLLNEMMKITHVGDMQHKKLIEANEQISRQKGVSETLNQELKRANVAKDKFYSIIAHELRNPLQFLLLSSDVIESELRTGKLEMTAVKHYVEKTYKTARNMGDLLENLLQWCHSQYGQMECRPQAIDLHALIEENIAYFAENAAKKNIRLSSEVIRDTRVLADENMIKSVIRNLLGNAVKFTHNGGKVSLFSRPVGGLIVTSVLDTGIGIPEEKLSNLFKAGENYTTSGTNQEKGSALGLVLCKEFVEKNGGQIWVKSSPGRGSLFEFSLPAVKMAQ